MTSPPHPPSRAERHRSRAEMLERQFLHCLELLERHQDHALPAGYLSDYQALGWIERGDGAPQVTSAGMQAVRSLQAARETRASARQRLGKAGYDRSIPSPQAD